MTRLLFATFSYAVFLLTMVWAVLFVADVGPVKTIDRGDVIPLGRALAVDLALLGLFAVQHSVMARPAFKRWWTRAISPVIERSTYVLASSLCLLIVFWQWRPLPALLWHAHGPLAFALRALSLAGWLLASGSTFAISHSDFFGLRQVRVARAGRTYEPPPFSTAGLYGRMRHPIMLGFLLAFWSTPSMSFGHLLFASASTVYIVVGIALEERDLLASIGEPYRRYRDEVPTIVPWRRRRRS